MAKARLKTNLLGLVDSDFDDDLTMHASKPKTATKMAAVKRGGPAASKVTKPKPAQKTARRTSGRIAAAMIEQVESRPALADRTEEHNNATGKRGRGGAAKDVDAADAPMSPPSSNAPKPKGPARGRPKASKGEVVEEPVASRRGLATAGPSLKGRKPAASARMAEAEQTEIPETQMVDAMDFDADEVSRMDEMPSICPTEPPASVKKTRAVPSAWKDSGSEESDVSLRRRLGELTRKYENLESRYKDLREIGVTEAERNFDKLKKQGEETTKTSNELIANLKSELAAQRELAREGARSKAQWQASEAEVAELQAKVADMAASLSEAKTEIKTLSSRLVAARGGDPSAAWAPGSAIKASTTAPRMGSVADAQMKEDLYSDLTGLIVRGVKREGEQTVYDCIQTGRNGTLHFKLSTGTDSASDNYDEAEFLYMPQLDANRDSALIETLPDYLAEEITFPRLHAAKFYARVMKALTESLG